MILAAVRSLENFFKEADLPDAVDPARLHMYVDTVFVLSSLSLQACCK